VKIEPSSPTLRLGFGAAKPREKLESFNELRDEVQKWVVQKAEQEL